MDLGRESKRGRPLRGLARKESGFTLIELMAAVLVTAVGALALVSTLDTSRELITFSEKREAAVHVAERDLERIQALPYDQVAVSTRPARSDDADDPAWYVTGDFFRWNQRPLPDEPGEARAPRCGTDGTPAGACERMAVDADRGAVSSAVQRVEERGGTGSVRIALDMQRFVTWVDDPCGACTETQDYKRVTVAVKIVGAPDLSGLKGGAVRPVLLTTLVSQDRSQ